MTLYCENQATIHILVNSVLHERMKHIEIDCHIAKEKIDKREIKTVYISSENQIGGIFTKALNEITFHRFVSKLSVINIHTPT